MFRGIDLFNMGSAHDATIEVEAWNLIRLNSPHIEAGCIEALDHSNHVLAFEMQRAWVFSFYALLNVSEVLGFFSAWLEY